VSLSLSLSVQSWLLFFVFWKNSYFSELHKLVFSEIKISVKRVKKTYLLKSFFPRLMNLSDSVMIFFFPPRDQCPMSHSEADIHNVPSY
jgi:hypothetical protein